MFIETTQFVQSSTNVDVTLLPPSLEGVVGSGERVHLTGTATKIRQGIRIRGHLDTRVALSCARCNEFFSLPVETGFSLIYSNAPLDVLESSAEVSMRKEDCALAQLDEKGRIDLLTLAQEQVALSLPLKPMCRESCQGLCSQCGANLNRIQCSCQREEEESRWKALVELKNRL